MTWNHTSPPPAGSSVPFDQSVFNLRAIGSETRIETDFGTVSAGLLTDQHKVRVLGGGFKAIDWVEQLDLDSDFLAKYPDLRPLRLPAGLFRADVPRRDIVLSRNTVICAGGASPKVGGFGAARQFAPKGPVSTAEYATIKYVVIGCNRPTMVRAEGIWLSC